MNINLGCGKKYLKNYINYDKDIELEETLPFEDNTINKIMLDNVVEHIHNQRQLLIECNRILKKNGFVEVYVPFFTGRIEHTKTYFPIHYLKIR